jgi:hypothetical protein
MCEVRGAKCEGIFARFTGVRERFESRSNALRRKVCFGDPCRFFDDSYRCFGHSASTIHFAASATLAAEVGDPRLTLGRPKVGNGLATADHFGVLRPPCPNGRGLVLREERRRNEWVGKLGNW